MYPSSAPRRKGLTGRMILRSIQILVTLGLLAIIARSISWEQVATGLVDFSWLWAVPVIGAIAIFFALGAVNNHLIISSVVQIPFRVVARIFMISVAAGVYTPAFVGEFGTVAWLLRRRGVRLSQSFAFSSIDKCLTLFVALAAAAVGFWLYFPEGRQAVPWIACGVVLGFLSLLVMNGPKGRVLIQRWVDGLLPASVAAYLAGIAGFFYKHPGRVALNLVSTGVRAVLGAVSIWAALRGLGVQVGFADVMMVNFVARVATLIPLAFNGLGLLEGAAMTLFTRIGVAPEHTLLAFLMDRAVTLLLIGAFALFHALVPGHELPPESSSEPVGRQEESR